MMFEILCSMAEDVAKRRKKVGRKKNRNDGGAAEAPPSLSRSSVLFC